MGVWAAWTVAIALVVWLRWPSPWILLAAGAVGLAGLIRGPGRARLALVPLGAGLALAALTQVRVDRVSEDWQVFWLEQEERAGQALQERMEGLIAAADAAVEWAASAEAPLEDLAARQQRSGLSALVLYDVRGAPVRWTGEHHGPVPERVLEADAGYAYAESPLFSYLYFLRPRGDGAGTALGAVLLRSDLPAALASGDSDDFTSRFERQTGEEVRISQVERLQGPGVWDFRLEDDTLFSMQVVRPSQAERRRALLAAPAVLLLGLALLGLLLLFRGSEPRQRVRAVGLSVAALAVSFPFERIAGLEALFSPAEYLLPGPLALPLGRVGVLAAAGLVLLGASRELPWRGGPLAALGVTVLVLPPLMLWLGSGGSISLMSDSEFGWLSYTVALALVGACVVFVALSIGRRRDDGPTRLALLGLGLAGAAGLTLVLARRVVEGLPVPFETLALWALPTAMVAGALNASGRRSRGARLAAAALVAVAAVTPWSWSQRFQARMEVIGAELRQLGSEPDAYLEFLLERLGEEMLRLQLEVDRPIELLYEAWERAGLAEIGVPMWLTLWTPDDLARETLPIGLGEAPPRITPEYLAEIRALGATSIRRRNESDLQYLAAYPLRDGWVGSAAVPPRRDVTGTSPLGPLFSSVERATASPLSLVPIDGPTAASAGVVTWTPGSGALNGERDTRFPEGWYRARYQLSVPNALLMIARGTLLFALVIAMAGSLYALGRWARPAGTGVDRAWLLGGFLESFRGRVTLALLGFFLLSTAVIGALALQTLTRSAVRTAQALAVRVALEAADAYSGPGRLGPLARQIGADLLLYENGALAEGAVHELLELGIYPAWLPYEVHEALSEGRTVTESRAGRLGGWQFVMAYRQLGRGQVLASPASLQVGANALRRRETVDLLAFAALLGAALSFGLALLVGRTLTSPMQTLQRASERVGAGDLSTRLPEDRADEFGAVFAAFNRMVGGLGTARGALERTTRRTQAIVEEAATGVVALDPDAAVVLVNPRAEAILGADLEPGQPLPREGEGRVAEFRDWVARFFEDGLPEGTTEFSFGDRRVRVRGRRISRAEPLGGAVFSIADVTDEMRAERVLAWGEMARQIAHEVKNPLTPIKLSVQHLQRAWDDRIEDFGAVLSRNVTAILAEIDRLAQIAGSFARLSAPDEETRGEPLEDLHLHAVVAEVLALYETTDRGIRFRSAVEDTLPPVRARATELKEVLLNLLENAREAVSAQGSVRIEASRIDGRVELRVVDDGVGIPEEDLNRVFEPRFSTRSRGTGLGLAIVRRLVESWGGRVSAESVVGSGTTIRVLLRTSDPEAGQADLTGSG